jgi:hypothetical protein
VIDVRDFHKAFSGHVAAQGVTFRVEPGELLAIIGRGRKDDHDAGHRGDHFGQPRADLGRRL